MILKSVVKRTTTTFSINLTLQNVVFIAEPPDTPEKLIVEVTGNDSVKISCIEAENPDSSICTKFNGTLLILIKLTAIDLGDNSNTRVSIYNLIYALGIQQQV